MSRYLLGVLASFFLFASFILGLFILIGQLSNKPFINIISFVHANNPQYNLSYQFALWTYCQGIPYGSVQSCSKAVPAYNWASTPGFNQMLPNYASSSLINHLFTANFILYFVGAGLSFLLWLASLPSLCAAGRRMKRGRRACAGLMALLTGFTFLVMLAALILGLVLVISSVKAIGQTSDAWQGHAGIAVWFTIGSVVSLFLAFLCYTMRSCLKTQNVHPAKRKYQPFDLPAHQPTHQQNTPQMPHSYDHQPLNNQYQTTNQTSHYPMANPIHTGQVDSSTEHYPSSLSQQYSPNLNMQYLSPIYNSGAPQRT